MTNPNRLSANEYEQVLSWVEACVPTLWSFVQAFPGRLCFEDLYQDTFLYALSLYPKAITKRCPVAYVRTCVRWYIHKTNKMISVEATISLDAPLTESGLSLGDLLPGDQPVEEQDHEQEDRRRQIVHEALHRLPLEDQKHIRYAYEMNDFEPVPLYPFHLNKCADSNIPRHVFRLLRRDTILDQQLYG